MSISAADVKGLRDSTGAGMMDCKRALVDADGDVERATELLRERGLSKAGKRAGRDTSEGTVAFSVEGGQGALIELGCETDFVAKTPDFQDLARHIADAVAAVGKLDEVDAALATKMDSGTVDDAIKAAVAKVGENIQLKRVASIDVAGVTGGYVHGAGTLGVLIGLETDKSSDEVGAVVKDVAMHVAAHDPTPIAIDRSDMPADVVEKERNFLKAQALESGKPEAVVEKMVDGRINKFYAENCLVEQKFVKDPDKSVRDILVDAGQVARFVRFKLGEAASE
jgi:elongation factor Ts